MSIEPDTIDYIFYAVFELHPYKFTFVSDEDGSGTNFVPLGEKPIEVPYGQTINMVELNKLFPWRDDSDLDLTSTYSFKGYSVTPTGNVIDMSTYVSRKD